MRARFGCLVAACVACAGPVAEKPSQLPNAHVLEVSLTYLGVAGWQIESEGHVVLVDPYFSRPDLSAEVRVDEKAVAQHTPPKVDLILVTHSHVDHLLDTPAVALRSGAQVIGSASTAHYAKAAGVPEDKIVPVQGGEDYEFDGGLSVRVIPGLHSALNEKHRLGSEQKIPADVKLPMRMDDFGEGGTFDYLIRIGGRHILVIGSANYIERELEGVRPDVAVVASGARQEIHDYSCRLMRVLHAPRVVIANHFDQWMKPLDEPLPAGVVQDLKDFEKEIHACAPNTRVVVPEHMKRMTL